MKDIKKLIGATSGLLLCAATALADVSSSESKRLSDAATVVRELVEEMTGTKVQWRERLDVYEHFVPDVRPWDVGPETRALADLCLVLMNANEFVYVY